jgi:Flp pilus assembly protein TadD
MSRLLAIVLVLGACAHRQQTQRADEGELLREDLAATFIQRGNYDAAIPLLRRALSEKPKSARLHALYGVVLREKKLYPQAESELRAAIAADARYAPAWADLGILLDLAHRPEAVEAHRAALKLAPGTAAYWNNLGFSYYIAGRNDEAITALEHALALDPALSIAYNNIGFAYARKGDFETAMRVFRQGGGEIAARLNLALVYDEKGETASAARLRAEAAELTKLQEPQEAHP